MKRFLSILIAICLIFTLFAGCAAPQVTDVSQEVVPSETPESTITLAPLPTPTSLPSEEQRIEELVKKQQTAIQNADVDAMMETINPDNTWFYTEMMHLVADQKVLPISEYTRSVSDIQETANGWQGLVSQSFVKDGEQKSSKCVHNYIFDGAKMLDDDMAFEISIWDQVTASHPEDYTDFTQHISKVTNTYLDLIQEEWEATLSIPVSIKVYEDQDVFLHSIKLSAPDWGGGWYETNESIKVYLYDTDPTNFEVTMCHETTHMMLSDVTSDNASYWLQEGMAETMPYVLMMNRAPFIIYPEVLKEAYDDGKLYTTAQHMRTNPETLTEDLDVMLYYTYSNAMAVYLLQNTDIEQLLSIFDELAQSEYIALTASEKIEQTNQLTMDAINKVAGLEYDDAFEEWLMKQF